MSVSVTLGFSSEVICVDLKVVYFFEHISILICIRNHTEQVPRLCAGYVRTRSTRWEVNSRLLRGATVECRISCSASRLLQLLQEQ
jgi:hypothetical protein